MSIESTKTSASSLPKGRFLIVDDEENIREILEATLKPLSLAIFKAESAEQGLEIIREENLDLVICDIQMSGMNGLEFLKKVKQEQPAIKFLMITAHGTMDTAVQAMRYGASDFLTKPFENEAIRQIARNLLSGGIAPIDTQVITKTVAAFGNMVGESQGFMACIEKARKAGQSDSTVLVNGESGTGKEVMAQAIHQHSPRSAKPFIAVNCGAIPENLIESELFGHEKGAFTGAISSKPGKFALAHGGTLFLDEIGEMPLPMQVKLLRVLQEKTIDPVGGLHPQKVDFRLIAATNKNLKEEVAKGRFREDLFYRLNIIPIELPPLRERRKDILVLARHFLLYFNQRYSCQYVLSTENEAALQEYTWPGNIRELANVMERAVVLASGEVLHFQWEENQAPEKKSMLKEKRQSVERESILQALDKYRWNKTQTAEALGISRRSLLYKIKEFGIA